MNENWTKPREDEILGSKKIVICGLTVGAFVVDLTFFLHFLRIFDSSK